MPLIAAQPMAEHKDTLSLRLDRAVHERLKQYAEFIQSPKDYVIGQALCRLFRKDKDFLAWLEARTATDGTGDRLPADGVDGAADGHRAEAASADLPAARPRARHARGV